MKKQIKKIISLVFIILLITLTPITTYINIENNVYATTANVLDSELLKQMLIPLLISGGLVFTSAESVDNTYERLDDYLRSLGPGFELGPNPNDPQGPKIKLGDVLFNMALGQVIFDSVSGKYKKIAEIPDLFWNLIKSYVDENYNVGENYYNTDILSSFWILGPQGGKTYDFPSDINRFTFYELKRDGTLVYNQYLNLNTSINLYNGDYRSYIVNPLKITTVSLSDTFTAYNVKNNQSTELLLYKLNKDLTNALVVSRIDKTLTSEDISKLDKINGVNDIVDNPNYDWVNNTTKEREIVIPISPDEVGQPKRDENGYLVPGVDSDDWIGVAPIEIPNMNPTGEPFKVLEPGQLPEVPANPQTIPEKILYFVSEAFKQITGIKQNTDISNPTIMGLPSADGTGNGGTGTPTKFDWGDFKHFFDIFFIFIYFIVMLILILLKLLQVVFSNLPNIPANTELFDNYPTILDGVNYIKNLKVGGLSITVQQAFEYVFLIFFFIFVLKQIRKLYGAYVYEENERSRADSGLSDTNFERKQYDYYSDARKNSNKYSNIKVRDLRRK